MNKNSHPEIGGRSAKIALVLLVIVYVFNFIDRQILAVLAEDIKADLNITDSDLGFLFGTAFAVFYSIFGITREILREAGPRVAKGSNSIGPVAIEILNKGLRPFTTKWHPRLLDYEQKRPSGTSALGYERTWEHAQEMQQELADLQEQMKIYADVLA
jgi:hypothetical protein